MSIWKEGKRGGVEEGRCMNEGRRRCRGTKLEMDGRENTCRCRNGMLRNL